MPQMEMNKTTQGLDGQTLRMVTLQYEPFIIRHDNETHTWYTGLCMDLLEILANALNFTYTIREPADQMFGVTLSNGSWAGLTGMLARKEADFALTAMSVSAERGNVSDHTTEFYHDSVVLIAPLPDSSPVGWSFLTRPLHWHLYLLLGCCLVLLTCVFTWVERRHMAMARDKGDERSEMKSAVGFMSFFDAAEMLSGALIGRAVTFEAVSTSGRILLYSWSLLSLVMIASYTSKLTSNSVLTSQPLPFNSLSELVKRSDYIWGFLGGTALESVITASDKEDHQQFYRRMLEFAAQDPDVRSSNLTSNVIKMQEMNFVLAASMSDYRIMKRKDCRITVAHERLYQDLLAVHLQKASPYTGMFNRVLQKLKEMGIMEHLDRKWFPTHTACEAKQSTAVPVSLELVHVLFVMAACSLAVAAVLLVLECVVYRRRQKRL